MKKSHIFAVVLTLTLLFSSCAKYEKILKSADNDTKYRMAMDFYSYGKYRKAQAFFESVALYVRGTERDDSLKFYYAKSFYLDKDPYSGEQYFSEFLKTFPRSKFADEASYLYAECLYQQSHRPELDPTPTQKSIIAFNEYLYRFPNGNPFHNEEAKTKVKELRQRLVDKSFMGAKLYYTIEAYPSAVTALKNHLKDYPESSYREESLFLILKSSYLYAKNSKPSKRRARFQNTIDEYLNLESEYPVSSYKSEASKIYGIAVDATQFGSTIENVDNKEDAAKYKKIHDREVGVAAKRRKAEERQKAKAEKELVKQKEEERKAKIKAEKEAEVDRLLNSKQEAKKRLEEAREKAKQKELEAKKSEVSKKEVSTKSETTSTEASKPVKKPRIRR